MAIAMKRVEQLAGLAVLTLLAIGSVVILRPFLAALTWALILSMATWPTYSWLEAHLGGRRTVAAAVMTLLVSFALLVPLTLVGSQLAENATKFLEWLNQLTAQGLPGPPERLRDLPLIGEMIWEHWRAISVDSSQVGIDLQPYVGSISKWMLTVAKAVGGGLVEVVLSVITVFFFYRDGAAAGRRITALLERLSAGRAKHLLEVAENTMNGVVYGIIGTAIAQGALAGVGFWIAGLPSPFLLGVLTMVLSLIPAGPPLVWLPAALWLFSTGDIGWGLFVFFWGLLLVSTVDNIIKPYFIHRGGTLPLLLVLLGIFGGVLTFGLLGLFIGPVVLAVVYTLLREWAPDPLHPPAVRPLPPDQKS